MSKTRIEELPRLQDVDPEDQGSIGKRRSSGRSRLVSSSAQRREADANTDKDIIVSRPPPGS